MEKCIVIDYTGDDFLIIRLVKKKIKPDTK